MEVWKDIKGWEKLYMVSNLGRVKSYDRLIIRPQGNFLKKGIILKPIPNSKGYLRVGLKDVKNKRMKKYFCHRLVAINFIENPHNKEVVNHIDFNYTNNKKTNLEWCTQKENMEHSIKHGRLFRTEEWLQNLYESQEKFYKPVIGINVKTEDIIKFKNINSVKEKGFRPGDVCNCCKGNRKTHKGYRWEYYKE